MSGAAPKKGNRGCLAVLLLVAAVVLLLVASPWNYTGLYAKARSEIKGLNFIEDWAPHEYTGAVKIGSAPTRDDFSSWAAWRDYEQHWWDCSWNGELPEGENRYKMACYENEAWASTPVGTWVAGLLIVYPQAGVTESDVREYAAGNGAQVAYLGVPPEGYVDFAHGDYSEGDEVAVLYFGDKKDMYALRSTLSSAENDREGGRMFSCYQIAPDEFLFLCEAGE